MPAKDPEKVLATPNKSFDIDKDSLALTAFQTACLAIIVLLAKFVGDLLYDAIITRSVTGQLIFLIFASALSFLEVINNWASIKKHFHSYNTSLFLIDVLTLGVFFWQIHILSRLKSESITLPIDFQNKMLLVVMVSYGIIFILYILWNIILFVKKECHSAKDKKENIENILYPAGVRFLQMLFSFGSVLFGIDRVPICILIFIVFLFSLYVLRRNWKLNIFLTIIIDKEQDPA